MMSCATVQWARRWASPPVQLLDSLLQERINACVRLDSPFDKVNVKDPSWRQQVSEIRTLYVHTVAELDQHLVPLIYYCSPICS